ncbi:MAG: TIGR00296 family protein [Thermoplasmata archaeon]|nr:TIGR00296 family protein [Thermoplasmata archaeon]
MWSQADGEAGVRLARWSVDASAGRTTDARPELSETFAGPGHVFVTLNTHPEGALRGCIGFVESGRPLEQTVERAALASCRDPRFDPLHPEETDGVVVEVSFLTAPERVAPPGPLGYPKAVEVGVHGLLVRRGALSGLLLPQVATEQGWSPDEFLAQACMKAGLLPDAWFEPDVEVYRFQADIFGEAKPRGAIVRRLLPQVHDGHPG